jgi:hypothetical protein
MTSQLVRRLAWGAAMVVGLTVAVGLYLAWQAAMEALEAEHTLQAYSFVLGTTIAYVEQHEGQWPTGWDELLSAATPPDDGREQRPTFEELKKRVRVDFSMTADEVAASDPEHFTAIVQTEPNFGPYFEETIKALQQAIRQAGVR